MSGGGIMYLRQVLLMCIFSSLLSCGGGEVAPSGPKTLTLVSANPAAGSFSVPVNILLIQIQVEEALDPALINRDTVHLMPGMDMNHESVGIADGMSHGNAAPGEINTSADAIEGNVWFDVETRTIHFEPSKILDHGMSYHIRIHDVLVANKPLVRDERDSSQNEAVIEINFTTAHAHEILRTTFNKEGVQTSHTVYTIVNNKRSRQDQYGKEGELKSTIEYGQTFPGTSNLRDVRIHRNPQGEIVGYNADLIENGVVIAHLRANEAGLDTVWGTADDLYSSYWDHKHEHLTHDITRNYRANTESRFASWSGINSPAFDLKLIVLMEHAGPKFQHRYIMYSSLGKNNEIDIDPNTQDITVVDDQISLWYKRDFQNGVRVRSWAIKGTGKGEGADQKLFTDDDISTGLTTYEYYPVGHELAGHLKKQVNYWQRGFEAPLGDWLSDPINNIVSSTITARNYLIYNYDSMGNKIAVMTFSPGDDGLMETMDDYMIVNKVYSTEPTIVGQLPAGL